MTRFSDVHMQQFKKMDSIANHASAFRADPTRFKPVVGQPLKQSPSRTDLSKPQANHQLKRKESKMEITMPSTKSATGLKRTQSKMDLAESSSKIPSASLKRTQSKMDLTGSSLPRSQSTVRLVPPTRDVRPTSSDGDPNQTAKRVKRTEKDDAATTRPMPCENKVEAKPSGVSTPARKITSQTALPRLAARLMTPTRSSIARSQTVKATKSTSMIPSMAKSPSTNNIFSPTHIAQTMRDGARESMRKVC